MEEIKAYKSINGKIFESKEEAIKELTKVANAGYFVALSINSYNVCMNPNLNKLQP